MTEITFLQWSALKFIRQPSQDLVVVWSFAILVQVAYSRFGFQQNLSDLNCVQSCSFVELVRYTPEGQSVDATNLLALGQRKCQMFR